MSLRTFLRLQDQSPNRFGKRRAGVRVLPPQSADSYEEDGFLRSRVRQANAETVTPVFNDTLDARIRWLLKTYEENIAPVPAARFIWLPESERFTTSKAQRLEAVFWILKRLPAEDSWQGAANQLACVLDRVEKLAIARARQLPTVIQRESRPMRLVVPQPENENGITLRVSHGIAHDILFSETGAIQILQLPPTRLQGLRYRQRALMEGFLLLDKPDAKGSGLWMP